MKSYLFKNGVLFLVDHYRDERPKCYTIFPDGREVPAIAKEKDFKTAREHGYGFDIWALNWQHEFIHNWLADIQNEPYSYTLDYVSKGGSEPNDRTNQEEGTVLAIQKLVNGIIITSVPHVHCRGLGYISVERLIPELKKILVGLAP